MKKYIADLNGEEFKSILYRGSYITINHGDIVNEDAPVRLIFSDLFKEYTEDIKVNENILEPEIEETSNIDDFFSDDINTYENDDVIIETE